MTTAMWMDPFTKCLPLVGLLFACVPDDVPAAYQRAEQSSRIHLAARPHLLEGIDDIWTRDVVIDERGEAHVRVGQAVDGIRVFGAEAIVHMDSTGGFAGFTD